MEGVNARKQSRKIEIGRSSGNNDRTRLPFDRHRECADNDFCGRDAKCADNHDRQCRNCVRNDPQYRSKYCNFVFDLLAYRRACNFLYQATDPATNTPAGSPNTPVDIPAAQAQTFYFSITPTAPLSQEIPLVFGCTNTSPAPVVAGLTTLLVTAGASPIPDLLLITETAANDGNLVIAGASGSGAMAAVAVNIGDAGTLTFTATDTPSGQLARNLPLNLTICQTDAGGACINPTTPGPSATLTAAQFQAVFFSVFVTGQGSLIPYDPANNRVFILAAIPSAPANDVAPPNATITIGEASAALKMCVSDVNDLQNVQNLSGNYCVGNYIVANVGTGNAATWRVVSNGRIISSSSNSSLGANASGDIGIVDRYSGDSSHRRLFPY